MKAVKRNEITKGKSTHKEKGYGMKSETLRPEEVIEKRRNWQRRLRRREQPAGSVGFWNQEKTAAQRGRARLLCQTLLGSRTGPSDSESDSGRRSVVSNSLRPHGRYSPWNSSGQNTGVGSLTLRQRILPAQESNLRLLHCRRILCQLSSQGSPWIQKCGAYGWPSNEAVVCRMTERKSNVGKLGKSPAREESERGTETSLFRSYYPKGAGQSPAAEGESRDFMQILRALLRGKHQVSKRS